MRENNTLLKHEIDGYHHSLNAKLSDPRTEYKALTIIQQALLLSKFSDQYLNYRDSLANGIKAEAGFLLNNEG